MCKNDFFSLRSGWDEWKNLRINMRMGIFSSRPIFSPEKIYSTSHFSQCTVVYYSIYPNGRWPHSRKHVYLGLEVPYCPRGPNNITVRLEVIDISNLCEVTWIVDFVLSLQLLNHLYICLRTLILCSSICGGMDFSFKLVTCFIPLRLSCNVNNSHRIWSSYSGGYEEIHLLGITLCSPLKINRCFRITCCLHLQSQRISQTRKQHEAGRKQSFMLVSFLAYSLTLKMEAVFLWNVSWFSVDYHDIISQ
jgi:hypothetical protein